jgi:hypothetical protein
MVDKASNNRSLKQCEATLKKRKKKKKEKKKKAR